MAATITISVSTGIRFLVGAKSDDITIFVRIVLPFLVAFPIAIVLFSWIEKLDNAYRSLLRQARELARHANTDPLTGLLNRRSFEAQFTNANALRSRGKFILADVDYLKAINDQHGHLIGDDAIIAAARALETVLGDECLIARIGRDEFCAYVPYARGKKLDRLVKEINEIASKEFLARSGLENVPLSISIGVQRCHPKTSFRDLIAQTDSDLYRKKRSRVAATDIAVTSPDVADNAERGAYSPSEPRREFELHSSRLLKGNKSPSQPVA